MDGVVRPAVSADSGPITRLLRAADFVHLHADWRLPVDWIGRPGFLLHTSGTGTVDGCLAATADPTPAAWVRVAAFATAGDLRTGLDAMLSEAEAALRDAGVTQLAWLSSADWVDARLPPAGFAHLETIETYVATRWRMPDERLPRVSIRPVASHEFDALAALEVDTFEPLWRHSADALRLAWQQAISFDVVEWLGRIVGFQYSTRGRSDSGHLVRITVHPDVQGKAVGTALLAHAFDGYRRMGLRRVTLNTQTSNLPSQTLYHKFGFRPTGRRYPVWVKAL